MSLYESHSIAFSDSELKQRCMHAIVREAIKAFDEDPTVNPELHASRMLVFNMVFFDQRKLDVAAKILAIKCIGNGVVTDIDDLNIEYMAALLFDKLSVL